MTRTQVRESPTADSLEHQLLAEDLADLLSMAGFAVVRRDAADCRRPALIRGCRPDLVAWHLIRPDHVVGEAKLGFTSSPCGRLSSTLRSAAHFYRCSPRCGLT